MPLTAPATPMLLSAGLCVMPAAHLDAELSILENQRGLNQIDGQSLDHLNFRSDSAMGVSLILAHRSFM